MSAQVLVPDVSSSSADLSPRGRLVWTAGNLLMLLGLYLLLYVGGLLADEQYNLMAAQRGSDIALPETAIITAADPVDDGPVAVARAAAAARQDTVPEAAPRRFELPQLNNPGGGRELNSIVPKVSGAYGPSTIEGIAIPRIEVDRKVVEVGWTLEEEDGQQIAIWDVAEYAVGHHIGSANPGQGGNIVLAGHSGGRAYPFNDIYYLKAGDVIHIWSDGRQYEYTVTERLVLDEIGPNVTFKQRIENARLIEPTTEELVTLVTCWPLDGPEKFNQRIVVRAAPAHAGDDGVRSSSGALSGGWTVR